MRQSCFFLKVMSTVGLLAFLSGCGGDGSSTVAGSGSAGGSAAASGTITGFGSVFVNGKKFETTRASFVVEGQSGSQNDLKLGMTVVVMGSVNGESRSATSVRQKDAVEGLVQSVAADGLSLVVMGQMVLVDNTTIFDNNFTPVAGDNVEVNGYIRPNGVIQATFIEKKTGGVTPEVRGFVKNHNDGAKTFQIGNLTVNYATAIINDMPSPVGNAWTGLLVEAKGTQFTPGPNVQTQGTLTATKVEPEDQGVQQADEFEVEGFVTQVVGPGDFFIGSTHVVTTGSTEFRGGTIDEIVVGAKLSAEGRLGGGILTAKHVKFHDSVRLEGDIVSINAGAKTFTIAGLPGVTINVNSQTEFKANGGATITGLNDLAVGEHVRVRGRVAGADLVIATRVEQRSADDAVGLQGPVQAASDPSLKILGVTVNTGPFNDTDFKGVEDQPIGRAVFFNAAKVGTVVKVKGRLTSGVVIWREVELEDEN